LGICKKLTKEFWEGDDAAPNIEIVDATLHAVARAGNVELTPYADLLRVSTLHKLARECYHRREWSQCLKYVERAEQMDPSSRDILDLHFRALLRLELWDRAKVKLEEIQNSGSRNYYYSKGFFHRLRGEFKEAVEAFKSAELIGVQNVALSRDHADCLHRLGRDGEALKRIELARKRDPANIFILDLYIRICLANGKIPEAEDALEEMERYDAEKKFFHHRKSRILAEKKLWGPALVEADAALKTGKSPFEVQAQRVDLLIELHRYDEANKELEKLKVEFGAFRKEIQFGLKCKFYIRQGNWRQAEIIWGELKEKDSEINSVMLKLIYELKAKDSSVPITERKRAEEEAALLDPDLRNIDSIFGRSVDVEEI
jgi:tetratricopeptide (TPR) repeat protein